MKGCRLRTAARSQAPAWECPCLGGSSLPFPFDALCFWRPGTRLEPPGILHSQAGAWERAREEWAASGSRSDPFRAAHASRVLVAASRRNGLSASLPRPARCESGRGFFALPTNREPSKEIKSALIICHPELAKELTPRQPALCKHSPFSKLTAPHDEPSVPIPCQLKRTSGSPREIPSTDSGQALRRLRMTAFGVPSLLVRPARCESGRGFFALPTNREPSKEIKSALIICHPELAKDLTPCQPALCKHSPFSKLTAPHDAPSVSIPCQLKRTSGSPREILRRLRMTAFGATSSPVRPVCKLVGNAKRGLPHSKALRARHSNAHWTFTLQSNGNRRQGFTLIEVLSASIASAILLLAVYGIFQRAIKTRNSATERIRLSAMAHRAANTIRNDLRNAYISGTGAVFASVLEGGQTNARSAFPGYLRFTTTTGRDTADEIYGDVQQIEYYIDNASSGDSGNQVSGGASAHGAGTLVRDITRDLLDTTSTVTRQERLLTRVESLEVEFYDGQTWQPSWESTGSNAMVPQAVRVHLQQAAAASGGAPPMPLEILVPWTTQPITTATASLSGSASVF